MDTLYSKKRYYYRSLKYRKSKYDILNNDLNSKNTFDLSQSWLSDREFLKKYRMSRQSFNKLVTKIEQNNVFKHQQRGPDQASPIFQLMVFLKYIGSQGSASCNSDLRNVFFHWSRNIRIIL